MKFLPLIICCMSYLNMNARVTISNDEKEIVIPQINSFSVTQDIKQLSDTATITLARNYKEFASGDILSHLKAGMNVKIEAGYNGNYHKEFTGFVKPGIDTEFPLVLQCDELFKLRQRNITHQWNNLTLRELLEFIMPSYKAECPTTNLGKMVISNQSPVHVLDELKKRFGFYSQIEDNSIYVGWAYDFKPSFTKEHTYELGKTAKDGKGLKYRTEADMNIRVKSVLIVNGKKKVLTAGSDSKDAKEEQIPVNEHLSETEVQKILRSQFQQRIYEGYIGEIIGFGVPRTRAGDSCLILNDKYPERDGSYLIEKVVTDYEESHIERKNSLSFKIV